MKTKITIEIDTEFSPIYPMDSDGEIDEENPATQRVEKEFHKFICQEMESFIEDQLEENVMENEWEYSVEEYDSFDDYGKISIKIIKDEPKKE